MRTKLAALLLLLVAGCSSTSTPNYDPSFGAAVRQARQRQVLDPQAGLTPHGPLALDGEAAAQALTRYRDTFKTPPPVVNVINIGGAVGGGGTR